MIVRDGSGGRDVDRGAPGAAPAGPEGAGGGVRGGGDRGVAGAGRPAAERAGGAGPARGRGGRVGPSGGAAPGRPGGGPPGGGRPLARPAGRLAAVADRVRLVPALAGAGPVRRPAAGRGGPPAGRGRGGGEGGRRPGPTLAIVDAQAGKGVAGRGPRGYDAAEGVVGRKRVALVDAEGHWLAVAVVPASVQDRDTPEALDAGKARWPTLREGIYDGAFAAERCREWSNVHGRRHRVVSRDPQAEGFVVLARRWGVERSFGWLSHWGGLARDRAGRLDVSAARLALVGVLSGFEALLNPRPVRAPAQ